MNNKFLILLFTLIASFAAVYAGNYQTDNFLQEDIETFCSNFNYEQPNEYKYISVGTGPMILIPNIGLGYRQRCYQLGWDTAISFSTCGYLHQISAQIVGHYYFNSFQANSAYVGLGAVTSAILGRSHQITTLSPDFVIGKQFAANNHKTFLEMHVLAPTGVLAKNSNGRFHKGGTYLPFVYIKYGFNF